MLKRLIETEYTEESMQSYLGMLLYGNAYNLSQEVQNIAKRYNDDTGTHP